MCAVLQTMITGIVSGVIAGVVSSLIIVKILKRRAEKVPERQMEALRFLSYEPKGWDEARSHLEKTLRLRRKRAGQTPEELMSLEEIESTTVSTRPTSTKSCLRTSEWRREVMEKSRRPKD